MLLEPQSLLSIVVAMNVQDVLTDGRIMSKYLGPGMAVCIYSLNLFFIVIEKAVPYTSIYIILGLMTFESTRLYTIILNTSIFSNHNCFFECLTMA